MKLSRKEIAELPKLSIQQLEEEIAHSTKMFYIAADTKTKNDYLSNIARYQNYVKNRK